MQKFSNILLVCAESDICEYTLTQAVEVCDLANGRLHVMLVLPEFPSALAEQQSSYVTFLEEKVGSLINDACQKLQIARDGLRAELSVETNKHTSVKVIRQVIRNNIDVLIKQQAQNGAPGYSALDMQLLRKCPCPVWLAQPIAHSVTSTSVAVAVDASDTSEEAKSFNTKLLQGAGDLAMSMGKSLDVVSCCEDIVHATVLQSGLQLGWMSVSPQEIDQAIADSMAIHKQQLAELVQHAQLSHKLSIHQHQLKGVPSEQIPLFIEQNNIDILVMGTVARTGLSGFIMGNTSESILQQLNCTLLAYKPSGFVSPVDI